MHEMNFIKLIEIQCDCPIVHMAKLSLKDGSNIYLGTQQLDDRDSSDDMSKFDHQLIDDVHHLKKNLPDHYTDFVLVHNTRCKTYTSANSLCFPFLHYLVIKLYCSKNRSRWELFFSSTK